MITQETCPAATVGRGHLLVPPGTRGLIQQIDKDGDAQILFESLGKEQHQLLWVFKYSFSKLEPEVLLEILRYAVLLLALFLLCLPVVWNDFLCHLVCRLKVNTNPGFGLLGALP